MSDHLPCLHPASAAVTDENGVSVCRLCSDLTPATPYRPQRPRECWAHPAGTTVTRKVAP